jgi:hypothetical protein
MQDELFSSPEEFPVSPQVEPGSNKARKMTAGSGQRLSESFPKSGPLGYFSRILLESATWDSQEYYLRWEVTATKCGCSVFQLVPSIPRTGGCGIGLWHTPQRANECQGPKALSRLQKETIGKQNPQITLPDHVRAIIPVPWRNVSNQEPGVSVERLVDKDGNPWKPGQRAYDKITGRLAQVGLTQELKAVWSTPTHGDASMSGSRNATNPNVNRGESLTDQPRGDGGRGRATWPTPKCSDHTGGPARADGSAPEHHHKMADYLIGIRPFSCLARTESFVVRLTTLSAWLMGYDGHYLKWWGRSTARSSGHSGTQSYHKSRSESSAP